MCIGAKKFQTGIVAAFQIVKCKNHNVQSCKWCMCTRCSCCPIKLDQK